MMWVSKVNKFSTKQAASNFHTFDTGIIKYQEKRK